MLLFLLILNHFPFYQLLLEFSGWRHYLYFLFETGLIAWSIKGRLLLSLLDNIKLSISTNTWLII